MDSKKPTTEEGQVAYAVRHLHAIGQYPSASKICAILRDVFGRSRYTLGVDDNKHRHLAMQELGIKPRRNGHASSAYDRPPPITEKKRYRDIFYEQED